MFLKAFVPFTVVFLLSPSFIQAQKTVIPPSLDSMKDSHVLFLKTVGITDTTKAIVRVLVKETGLTGVPIQGATVLLRRDKDKMLGRVTKQDGRCNFMPTPAMYTARVQLTGYKTLESSGLLFERGKVYELEVRVAHN
ncbi:MAG: carboxypeptidase regulatory-like domain-containing protein [Saprospiraceae bacterium]|nr:carboxypeptidase regulatory-like domain-containing protein [Saprospiraceae bacterium]